MVAKADWMFWSGSRRGFRGTHPYWWEAASILFLPKKLRVVELRHNTILRRKLTFYEFGAPNEKFGNGEPTTQTLIECRMHVFYNVREKSFLANSQLLKDILSGWMLFEAIERTFNSLTHSSRGD